MSRIQLNVRMSEQVEKLVDKKRIQLTEKLGAILLRLDVVRFALEPYLAVGLRKWEANGNRASTK